MRIKCDISGNFIIIVGTWPGMQKDSTSILSGHIITAKGAIIENSYPTHLI